jgi:hypothetical protein
MVLPLLSVLWTTDHDAFCRLVEVISGLLLSRVVGRRGLYNSRKLWSENFRVDREFRSLFHFQLHSPTEDPI